MNYKKSLVTAAIALCLSGAAFADLTVGVVQPLTGPASGLGIPIKNAIALWPQEIAGQKLKVIVLDDASDPTAGVKATQRLVTEDKVDVIVGSTATPVAIPMADVTAESGTPQLSTSPAALPPGKDKWFFRLPQSNDVMAHAMVAHMKKHNIKTIGFLGYTDAYGELWLKAITAEAEKNGMKIVGAERFARSDTSATAQALKLVSANPDAILIVASGSGAGMPQRAIVERGYKGKIYQTHGVANNDFLRVCGKDCEGTWLPAGPLLVADQLPADNPVKASALSYVHAYEKAYGAGSVSTFGGHVWDAGMLLQAAIPQALKKGQPGSKEFRAALREALENVHNLAASHGIFNMSASDHLGLDQRARVMVQIVNGKWKLLGQAQ